MTARRRLPQILLALLPLLVPGAAAQSAPPEAEGDPRAIIDRVDRQTEAVKAVSYTLHIRDTQRDSGLTPVEARVISEKIPGKLPLLKVEAYHVDETETRRAMTVVHDGRTFDLLDWPEKRVERRPSDFIGRRLERVRPVYWLSEFMIQEPFEDERHARALRYDGREEIAGVACDKVFVEYQQGPRSRWWFGVDDGLPRRVDRLRRTGMRIYEVHDLRVLPVVAPGTFEYTVPPGFDIRDVRRPDAPAFRRIPDTIQIGREVPGFDLPASDGRRIRLRDLRGKVVVLQFWNQWSARARTDMPEYSRLADEFSDHPVVFLGVNCYEDDGVDVGGAFRRLGQRYATVSSGTDFAKAVGIPGVPAWLVVDAGGRAEDSASGPVDVATLRAVLEQALHEKREGDR